MKIGELKIIDNSLHFKLLDKIRLLNTFGKLAFVQVFSCIYCFPSTANQRLNYLYISG